MLGSPRAGTKAAIVSLWDSWRGRGENRREGPSSPTSSLGRRSTRPRSPDRPGSRGRPSWLLACDRWPSQCRSRGWSRFQQLTQLRTAWHCNQCVFHRRMPCASGFATTTLLCPAHFEPRQHCRCSITGARSSPYTVERQHYGAVERVVRFLRSWCSVLFVCWAIRDLSAQQLCGTFADSLTLTIAQPLAIP